MKKTLLIILVLLTLVSIPVTVYFLGKNQEIRKYAAPATTVSLSPAVITTTVGETFTLSAEVDTGTNQVVSANVAIEYDPTKFEAQSITNGPLFPKILVSGAVAPGVASITVGASSTTEPITGSGVAAIIRLKAIATAPSPVSIKFSDSTFIGGIGEEQTNVLVGSSPASVTINAASVQTTPTTTPTPTQEATQALIQTSPTPTPSISTATTPSPTVLLTPTATPSGSTRHILTLDNPTEGSTISNSTTIQGKAAPGATVTIVIHSDPITATVVADENGNWVFTPSTPLPSGTHSVLASVLDPSTGDVQTESVQFTVSDGTNGAPMPNSGTTEYTFFFLFLAIALTVSGFTMTRINRIK